MRAARSLSIFGAVSVVVLVSCSSEQTLRDDCPTAGTACPACTSDADCVIQSNPCDEVAICTHQRRDPPLAFRSIGCDKENDKPPPDRCGCVQGVCRSK